MDDGVSASPIVAEFDERGRLVEPLNDRPDLSADEPLFGQVAQQCHRAQQSSRIVAIFRLSRHHKTQQVTKRGTSPSFCTIQIVRTMVHAGPHRPAAVKRLRRCSASPLRVTAPVRRGVLQPWLCFAFPAGRPGRNTTNEGVTVFAGTGR